MKGLMKVWVIFGMVLLPVLAEAELIVFSSNRDGNYQIYVMNPDGTGQTRLTNNLDNDFYPSWSPDGSKIVFVSDRDGNNEIYVMNADGTNPIRLTNNTASDVQPSWSPDGSKIVFRTNRDGNDEVYVMNVDGTNPINLTNHPNPNEGEPDWSPDGTKIVFSSWRDGIAYIYIMNSDGTNPHRLLNTVTWVGDPHWSPDGTSIGYTGWGQLYITDIDGINTLQLTNDPYIYQQLGNSFGSWSPDGDKIVYMRNYYGNFEIEVMNSDGSNRIRLTNNNANDQWPSWSPPPPQLQITTQSLPNGNVGTFYSQTLSANGGTPPYTWSKMSGSLPYGLSLSSNGTISGTPVQSGTFTFTVQVTDLSSPQQSSTKELSMIILDTSLDIILNVPYFSQKDPEWGSETLGNYPPNSGYTIGNSGCLITSISMIINSYLPDYTNPLKYNNWLKENDGFPEDSGEYIWGKVSTYTNGQIVGDSPIDSVDWAKIDNELSNTNKRPLIVKIEKGTWTHYIVIKGKKGGRYYINDPQTSTIETLNYWLEKGWSVTRMVFYKKTIPTCKISLRRQGTSTPIDQINIREFFDIYVGDSSDDVEISQVRFSSDDSQDGASTGEWTDWYNWNSSAGDWNATTKIKAWSFTTKGEKEVWTEIKDNHGNVASANARILAHPGYALIVAGQGNWIPGDKHSLDHCANNAYRVLRNLGFDDEHIYYLNCKSPQDIDKNGDDEVDMPALLSNFEKAINEIKDKIGNNHIPFVLYLVGHGVDEPESFVFDENNSIEGYLWVDKLQELLSKFSNETKMFIMINSCYSGRFITSNKGISAQNRIIITSTRDDQERRIFTWVRFSDRIWGNLNKGLNVKEAFVKGVWEIYPPLSLLGLSWLDDNGDRKGHPPDDLQDDGELAEKTKIGTPNSENLELIPWYEFIIHSPSELRVYDSQNRVTGLVAEEIKVEIPNSAYYDESIAIFSPSDSYRYVTVGTETGTYGLDISSIKGEEAATFTATQIPVSTKTVHQYTVDWSALSQWSAGVTFKIDANGDGLFEQGTTTGNTFTGEEFQSLPPPQVGTLSIISMPSGAEIYIDGVKMAQTTPATLTYIPAGTHTIVLNLYGYHKWTDVVTIIASETTKLEVTLTPAAASNLTNISAYPNPCKGYDKVTFKNLTDQCRISIYTIVGELVYEQEFTNTNGSAEWKLRNNAGKKVASGIYIYLITNNQNQKATGKIGVIK